MQPVKFTVKDGVTHFHYKFSELRKFISRGLEHGDVGPVLIKREGNLLTYKGFGTIEHPFTKMLTLQMQHFEPFDGKLSTDEQRINPEKSSPALESYRMVFLDLSDAKK